MMTMSSSSSTTSGCLSVEETSEDHLLPITLAAEELKLALNKEATEEELNKAINRCKDLVLECENISTERKWLVRHLIELRLRLQECKEAHYDPEHPRNKSSGASKRTVRGHHLLLQPFLKNTASKYCDHCTGAIWHLVQAWYKCEDCGYSCHHKCIAGIIRECAHVTISERGEYERNICPEEGLSAQQYQCAECKVVLPIAIGWSDNEVRRCDYTGMYYCSACHWGGSAIIPARLMHNWDFVPQPVSQASLQLLKITANRPLINLEKLNPRLFSLVHELDLVKRIRNGLNEMRKYISICRLAQEDHFLWKNSVTSHLIESPDLYSMQDLLDTNTGELPSKLLNLASVFLKHIKDDCEVCRGRGHLCQICSNDEVLFTFDDNVVICKICNSVLHKVCYFRKNNECPKCERLRIRHEKLTTYKYSDDDDNDDL
ncbi:PREDICTED: differentially expressed in FDCP 8 homolog isoform X2 [Nicrophorus vespilloides]|uniref:Differentially expressed in FDCP 8 homolog isoform X2 n=1 Tax=Nicrophorus vespilloides TaxID=110193 RepID=A0ABM1MU39_NICVS|nr:PREDICTED: differentially expressed in FDCP 8 homolog isoform X2 [Nicrophorus vespilloides]